MKRAFFLVAVGLALTSYGMTWLYVKGGITAPTDIANCILWLDGNDNTTMGSPSTGNTFDHWDDKSSASNDFVDSAATDCTWISNGSANSLGIARCAGSNTGYSGGTSVFASSAYTVFVAAKIGQEANWNRFFAFNISGAGNNSNVFATIGGTEDIGMVIAAGGGPRATTSGLDTSSFHSYGVSFDGASTYALYYDGVSQSVATSLTGNGNANAVGYDGNSNSGNNADYTFVAMYDRALNATEISQLHTYATTR